MLFNSLHFLVFFPVVTALYFATPQRRRWVLLLAASYYFYMCWKAEYLILIVVSTLIDYFAGLRMGRLSEKSRRTKYLVLSLLSNLGILFAFKYFNFFNDSARLLFDRFNIFYGVPELNVLLPVGISFYTFQTLSYSIDVYRGQREPEKHLGVFALYVAFFPQLVAGPIERSTRLLPQFYEKHRFDYGRAADGLSLMLWGFFKKVVIADRLALFVNEVYNQPHDYQGVSYIVATVFFAFQIYCDFSGYSDIAIGAAQVLGYDLMDNFDRPYFSRSIGEFWKRWHISLSTWFRDYFYIPIGGNRVSMSRRHFNLAATFLISGLWHGANWTFIVWGGIHGLYMITGALTLGLRRRAVEWAGLDRVPLVHRLLQVVVTFALVSFSWIFFRANTLSDALLISRNLFTGVPEWFGAAFSSETSFWAPILMGQTKLQFFVAVGSILVMESIHIAQGHGQMRHFFRGRPVWVRWTIYYLLTMGILLFGVFEQKSDFIYFQF